MTITAQTRASAIESAGADAAGRNAEVAVLADGRYVVVWQEVLASPSGGFIDTDGAIFARIYNANGTAAGDILQVNDWMPGVQDSPQVAATANGGFAISFNSTLVWGSGPTDVDGFMVRFDATGAVIAQDDGDGNLLPYRDIDPDNPGDGDTGSFLADAGGGYVALVREADTSSTLTTVTLLAPDGADVGATTDLLGFDRVTDVTRLEGGNVAIVGERDNFVVLRISDTTLQGEPVGIPGLVRPVLFTTMLTAAEAQNVAVTALTPGGFAPGGSNGGFVVSALQPVGLGNTALVLQSYTAWGALAGQNTINIALPLAGATPGYDVLALRDGTFMVAWTARGLNGLDVYAGHYDANGAALGAATVIQGNATAGDQSDPSLGLMADGRVLVSFTDTGGNPAAGAIESLHSVLLTVVSASSSTPPSQGADRLAGTGAHDAIDGLFGNDTIYGFAGNDALFGSGGDDSLIGGLGADGLIGGGGNDVLSGGEGADGLSGGVGVDTLRGEAGRDILSGGAQADRLYGGTESDRLDGGAGSDILEGGSGADIFVFRVGGGSDTVTDFAADDYLRLDRGLWAAAGDLSAAQVLNRFADVVDGNTVLTFTGGETVTLVGYAHLAASDLQLV